MVMMAKGRGYDANGTKVPERLDGSMKSGTRFNSLDGSPQTHMTANISVCFLNLCQLLPTQVCSTNFMYPRFLKAVLGL